MYEKKHNLWEVDFHLLRRNRALYVFPFSANSMFSTKEGFLMHQIASRITYIENLIPPCSATLTFAKERRDALMSNGGRSQIKIDERQKKWDEHKQAGTKGKYWSEMRENIKLFVKSFKRERVHAALLRRTRFVIVSVRKRSFPVYEPASLFLLLPQVFRAFTCRPTDTADDTGDDKSIRRRGNAREDVRAKKRENYCQSRA